MALLSLITMQFLVLIIRIYQQVSRLLLKPHCRFYPTCSHYAIKAFYKFGVMKGSLLTLIRISKCHPINQGGNDPLP